MQNPPPPVKPGPGVIIQNYAAAYLPLPLSHETSESRLQS